MLKRFTHGEVYYKTTETYVRCQRVNSDAYEELVRNLLFFLNDTGKWPL